MFLRDDVWRLVSQTFLQISEIPRRASISPAACEIQNGYLVAYREVLGLVYQVLWGSIYPSCTHIFL